MKKPKIYLILIRGINVGGKNKMPMSTLKKCLEALGFCDVLTYIASGNVILRSDKTPEAIKVRIEKALPQNFKLDSELIKVLVLSRAQLKAVIDNKPKGFGDLPQKYCSDVIFLIDITVAQATRVFSPKEGVDVVTPGKDVIYSQRLGAKRVQSRLSKIVGTPAYKSMTIRNWNTTTKLLALLEDMEQAASSK